jgi:hypothetical protein
MSQAALIRLLGFRRIAAVGALLGLTFLSANAHAQATPTAIYPLGVSVFAGAQGVHPEFNGSPNNYGFFLGADATRYFRLVSPSLELRFNDASGSIVSQRSFLVGIKAEHAFGGGRFHPYLDGMIGPGSTHFEDPAQPSYTQDTSLVLAAGAGLDFNLTRSFAVKGDIQIQHWRLGQEEPVFSPEMVSVGLVYRPNFSRLGNR